MDSTLFGVAWDLPTYEIFVFCGNLRKSNPSTDPYKAVTKKKWCGMNEKDFFLITNTQAHIHSYPTALNAYRKLTIHALY